LNHIEKSFKPLLRLTCFKPSLKYRFKPDFLDQPADKRYL